MTKEVPTASGAPLADEQIARWHVGENESRFDMRMVLVGLQEGDLTIAEAQHEIGELIRSAASGAVPVVPADESAWLIEHRPSPGITLWWDGTFERSARWDERPTLTANMVNDANKAARFATQESAQKVLDGLLAMRPLCILANAPSTYLVTEHLWTAAPTPQEAMQAPVAWQPIETAPNECEVLVWFGPIVGVKSALRTELLGPGIWSWCVDDEKFDPHPVRRYCAPFPTHWMPLPPSPKEQPTVKESLTAREAMPSVEPPADVIDPDGDGVVYGPQDAPAEPTNFSIMIAGRPPATSPHDFTAQEAPAAEPAASIQGVSPSGPGSPSQAPPIPDATCGGLSAKAPRSKPTSWRHADDFEA